MIPNNLNSVEQESTTDYFNNVSSPSFIISEGENNIIVSYFEKLTGNKENGAALSRAFIFTAKAQGYDVLELFQEFTKLPMGQLNQHLVTFLNLNRVGTSFLGLSNNPVPNKYIARSILP